MRNLQTLTAAACGLLTMAAIAGCGSSSPSAGTTPKTGTTATSSPANHCTPAHPNVPTLTKGDLTVLVYVSPPYTTQNGSAYGGVDGNIVKDLAKMECLTLKEKSVAPAALIASVQSQRGDVAIGGIYYTSQRAKTLSLSTTMYRDGMALLSKSAVTGTLAALKGKSVGVIQGYLWDKDLQTALGAGNVKIYQAEAGMITDLKNGRLDAAVLTNAEAGYRAKQDASLKETTFQPTAKVSASQGQNKVVLALPKQAKRLTDALNSDIKKLLSNGSIAKILKANGMDPALAGPSKH